MSAAWHDRPMPPLETAIFWTEFAARYSNFTFRTAAADVPTYQYANLDIIAVFLLLAVIIIMFCITVCSRKRTVSKEVLKRKGKKPKRE